jgi:hypothetical protein
MRVALLGVVILGMLPSLCPAAAPPLVDYDSVRYAPADPQLPAPLVPLRIEQGGLFLWWGSNFGAGWKFTDGSSVAVGGFGRTSIPFVVRRRPVYDTECQRYSVLLGTQFGVAWEGYLGHGWAAQVQAAFPMSYSLVSLHWYPAEFIQVQFDPWFGTTVAFLF